MKYSNHVKCFLSILQIIVLCNIPISAQVTNTITYVADSSVPWDQQQVIRVSKGDEINATYLSGKWNLNTDSPNPNVNVWRGPEGEHNNQPGKGRNAALHYRLNSDTPVYVGRQKSFVILNDGTLRFWCNGDLNDVANNQGTMTLKIIQTCTPGVVNIPGLPGNAPQTQNSQHAAGIDGLPIVEEDKEYTWRGLGQTPVLLAPGSKIAYTFDFGDSHSITPFSDSFDPSTVPNVAQRILGSHKYKENGIYKINLSIRFTRRIVNPDASFRDIPENYHTNPFQVIVVDHIPDYMGNAFIFINGPGNSTSKNYPDLRRTDYVYEDSDETFFLVGLFKFFAELPAGTDTGVSPDRFGGVDPATVKYRVDFGDGTPETNWIHWQEVNQIRPKNIQDPITQEKFESSPFQHLWPEPGEYQMKVRLAFQEVEYTNVSFNGTTYSYQRVRRPETFITKLRTIVVIDRTPPRLSATELVDLVATTGDELSVIFEVEDNSLAKALQSSELLIERWDKPGYFTTETLNITELGPSAINGKIYEVKGKWRAPDQFAHKNTTTLTPLKYYLVLKDGEGNVNEGRVTIVENRPPHYGADHGGISYGNLTVVDNDPPSIRCSILMDDKEVLSVEAKEAIRDICGSDVCSPGDIVCCDHLLGTCQAVNDPEVNPSSPAVSPTGVEMPFPGIEIPEDSRYKLLISTNDNVDGKAHQIDLLLSDGKLKSVHSGEYNDYGMFSQRGTFKFSVVAHDVIGGDGSNCKRRIDISAKVLPRSFSTSALQNK